jgi:L,D-peptidoglycan transpeptidase YkuD (ErfK/YbiS/YcfS/YnhG family)
MRLICVLLLGWAVAGRAEPRQMIVATAPDWNSFQGSLRLFSKQGERWAAEGDFRPVLYGKKGMAWGKGLHPAQPGLQKKEGDARTPAGLFRIGMVLGNDETLPKGSKGWKYHRKTASTAWIDDPALPHYNDVVEVDLKSPPEWFSHQRMKIEDPVYHWLVLIEHNYGRGARPGLGSAIFFHTRRGEAVPTGGCTTMDRKDLEELIQWLDPRGRAVLAQMPREEYARRWKEWKLPPPELALP